MLRRATQTISYVFVYFLSEVCVLRQFPQKDANITRAQLGSEVRVASHLIHIRLSFFRVVGYKTCICSDSQQHQPRINRHLSEIRFLFSGSGRLNMSLQTATPLDAVITKPGSSRNYLCNSPVWASQRAECDWIHCVLSFCA